METFAVRALNNEDTLDWLGKYCESSIEMYDNY